MRISMGNAGTNAMFCCSVRGLARWIGASAIAAGVGTAAFSFSRSVPLSAALMAIAGFGMFMTAASCNTIVQSIVPEDKRGRVMSYYTMFFIGVAPFGHYLAGWLAEHVGVRVTFMIGGTVSLLTGVVFALQFAVFRAHLRTVYVSRGIIPASEDTGSGKP